MTATATVTEVDRRRVVFDIRVEDDMEVIGSGTHERFVDRPAPASKNGSPSEVRDAAAPATTPPHHPPKEFP